jgi:hypothetical protein
MSLPLPGGNGLNCYNTIPSHEMDASVVGAAIKCQAEVAGVILRSTYSSTKVRVPERRHDLARSMPGASVDRTTGLRPTRRRTFALASRGCHRRPISALAFAGSASSLCPEGQGGRCGYGVPSRR